MVSCKLLKCFLLTFLFSIQFSTSYAQLENNNQPEVTIDQGTLLGKILTSSHSRNISAFIGIPYAEPPIDDLRFSKPVAAVGWNETRNATVDINECPQISDNVIVGDEDCLYLNVYTPRLPESTNSSLLPTMVYIHGGGLATGSGLYSEYGPEYILNADVVLVMINYRLGALGFLSTGDDVASGNWGLKDQILALRWVQDNIAFFGGDPDQVTVFGESAGGAAIDILTLSNEAIGLFHKCITQSGSALATQSYRTRATAAKEAFELGNYFDCSNDTSNSLIDCLRTYSFTDIVLYSQSLSWGTTDEPDIDGAIITDSPTNLFADGRVLNLPQISGTVRDEAASTTAAFYDDEEVFLTFLQDFDSSLASLLGWTEQSDSQATRIAALKSYYFNDDLTQNKSLLLSNLTLLITDRSFNYPHYNALQQRLALGVNPQYVYTFNYRGTFSYSIKYTNPTVNYGVSHADDLLYLFSMDWMYAYLNGTMSVTDFQMVDNMVQLWTSFAINGTPTTLDGITWKPYSTAEKYYLRIGNESDVTPELQYSTFEERMQFWARLEAGIESDESDAVTSSPNFLILVLLACSKFILSAATAN